MVGYRLFMRASRRPLPLWRVLKQLGAVNARQSLWILPDSLMISGDLKEKSDDIETCGGRSMLIASMFLEERPEQRVVALFPPGEERA